MTLVVLALLSACNGDSPTGVRDDATVAPVTSSSLGTAVVGSTLGFGPQVKVTDASGAPLAGARVEWDAEQGTVASRSTSSDAQGVATVAWTLGTTAGPQAITARVGSRTVRFTAVAEPDRAASMTLALDVPTLTALGDTGRLVATVRDRFGNVRSGGVNYSTMSGHGVFTLLAGGRVVATARGAASVRAAVDTVEAFVTVSVAPPPLAITRVTGADTLRPGRTFVLEGTGFPRIASLLQVELGGVNADVVSVSPTRAELSLPASGAYTCAATGARPLAVRVGTGSAREEVLRPVTFAVAERIALAPGASRTLLDPAERWCLEFAGGTSTEARYVVAVLNTSQSPSASTPVTLRGMPASGDWMPAGARMTTVTNTAIAPAVDRETARAMATARAEAVAHDAVLEHSRDIARRFGSPAPVWRALRAAGAKNAAASSAMAAAQSSASLKVGDEVERRVLYNSCTNGPMVKARVVYAGTRTVILEDVNAYRAGTMDDEYALLGAEYDQVLHPLLAQNLGDPLAMDTLLNRDGRITMFFTRYVNDELSGIAGYVTACNFYPKSTFSGSNEDEVFYARVAAANQSPAEWRRGMRATVLHEAKHIASMAERFSRNVPFEESWLEESTARIAEELYSRTFSGGGAWKANAGWAGSVGCELSRCDDRPLVMWKIAPVLHQFWRSMPGLSPLGRAADGDFTFYASGWSLVRWAVDQHATDERTFLRDLVRGGQLTGIAALAQRTGRPANELLAEWALMQAVDDRAGFAPTNAKLTFPSWNLPDLMAGLNSVNSQSYSASPLAVTEVSGLSEVNVPSLRGFSASYVEAVAPSGGSQVLGVSGPGSLGVNASVRLALVRVR